MHWIYLIHEFHNLSWITEINELFHDILIYWDATVFYCVLALFGRTYAENTNYVKKKCKHCTKLDDYILFHIIFPVYNNIFMKKILVTPIDTNQLHHLTMLLLQPKAIVCWRNWHWKSSFFCKICKFFSVLKQKIWQHKINIMMNSELMSCIVITLKKQYLTRNHHSDE